MTEDHPADHHPLQAAIHTLCAGQEATKALREFREAPHEGWSGKMIALNLQALDELLRAACDVAENLAIVGADTHDRTTEASAKVATHGLDWIRAEIRSAREKLVSYAAAPDFQTLYDLKADAR